MNIKVNIPVPQYTACICEISKMSQNLWINIVKMASCVAGGATCVRLNRQPTPYGADASRCFNHEPGAGECAVNSLQRFRN